MSDTKLIYKKMSEVMKDVGPISKDQKNQSQGFKFRGIDQFVNALYPALIKHGVFMTPRCVKEEHEIIKVTRGNGKDGIDKHVTIQMEYDFFAEDGSKVTVGPVPAEGLDSGDKSTNKALSAALKYALIQTFCVPTEDMVDGDLESPSLTGNTTSSSYQSSGGGNTKAAANLEAAKKETAKASIVDQMNLAKAGSAPAETAKPKTTKFAPKRVEAKNDLDI